MVDIRKKKLGLLCFTALLVYTAPASRCGLQPKELELRVFKQTEIKENNTLAAAKIFRLRGANRGLRNYYRNVSTLPGNTTRRVYISCNDRETQTNKRLGLL